MKAKNYIIPALMLGLAVPVSAVTFNLAKHNPGDGVSLIDRSIETPFKAVKKANSSAQKRVIGFGGDAISEIEKYGTLRLVFEEDFSKMSAGSIEEPECGLKMTLMPDEPEYDYPWWNLLPEFTNAPHWGVEAEGSSRFGFAGGCYYMQMVETEGMMGQTYTSPAWINTPLIKVDEDGGLCVLEFKARSRNQDETYDGLIIKAQETNNMAMTWRAVDEEIGIQGIPSEWTTYRILFREGGPTTLFMIVGVAPGEVYIDDVKVYQVVPLVMYPEVKPHTDYKGTSFTANWNAAEGADSYLLTVYYYDENGLRKDFVTDKPVNGTSAKVEGVVSGDIYFYTVKSVKGSYVSVESPAMMIYDLVAPEMNTAEITGKTTYTASWNAVPGADVYNYVAYVKREATEDGPFVVTSEDFKDITLSDGSKTGLTKEDPDTHTIVGQFYPQQLVQQGWYGECSMPYDDYMAFDSFHFEAGGNLAGFFSPALDMSKDGGKFTLTCDLAAETDDGGNTTKAAIALYNWDDEVSDWTEAEMYRVENLNIDWKQVKFNFTKGTERSMITILAYGSYGNLYLDNLEVVQNYKKGEYLMDPFLYVRFNGSREEDIATQVNVKVTDRVRDLEADIYHQVSAFGRIANQQLQVYEDRESAFSELSYVMKTSEVKEIESVQNEGAAEYFTIDGLRVNNTDLTPGLYIVRKGEKVTKQLLK